MIDLYGMSSPNVIKVLVMLEELELPYRFHHVPVWKQGQFEPAFLALNPNAKVPVIVDADGPGGEPLTVFESGAIMTYLAEKTGKLLPTSGKARYDVLQWMMIQMTGIGPMFGQYVHFSRYATDVAYANTRYRSEAIRLIDLVEERLGQATYLGGEAYSIADIASYPWLSRLQMLNLPVEGRSGIARWIAAIESRPAVQRAMRERDRIQAENDASRAGATPEDIDRTLGRGRFARTA